MIKNFFFNGHASPPPSPLGPAIKKITFFVASILCYWLLAEGFSIFYCPSVPGLHSKISELAMLL